MEMHGPFVPVLIRSGCEEDILQSVGIAHLYVISQLPFVLSDLSKGAVHSMKLKHLGTESTYLFLYCAYL